MTKVALLHLVNDIDTPKIACQKMISHPMRARHFCAHRNCAFMEQNFWTKRDANTALATRNG